MKSLIADERSIVRYLARAGLPWPALWQWALSAVVFAVVLQSVSAPCAKVSIKEFRLPTEYSYPMELDSDADGNIWITAHMAHKIVSFDPGTKAFKEYDLPKDSNPVDVAVDKNGLVWFTLSATNANAIGSLNPSTGEQNIYKVPTPDAAPDKLVFAADGSIWFTEKKANKIAHFNNGEFKEFPIPTENSQPSGIGIDSKGVVWISESSGNAIAKLEPSTGKITEYPLRHAFANPADLVIDKDDHVWIVEMSDNRLTMFDSERGEFNEAIIPTPGSVPVSLAISKDDIIWFTENRANNIGMFDPVKAIFEEYDIPTARALPTGIFIDDSGRIWFTEGDRDANSLALVEVKEEEEAAVKEVEPTATASVKETEREAESPLGSSMTRAALAVFFVVLFLAVLWYILRKRGR